MQFQKQPPGVFIKKVFLKTQNSQESTCARVYFWTPGRGRKGPMNQGLSVLPSESFLRIGSLVFCETHHVFRGLCRVVGERFVFFEKIFLPQKWEKWAKNRLFKIYWKIQSLIFSEFERRFILFDAFLHKLHIWEKFDF